MLLTSVIGIVDRLGEIVYIFFFGGSLSSEFGLWVRSGWRTEDEYLWPLISFLKYCYS